MVTRTSARLKNLQTSASTAASAGQQDLHKNAAAIWRDLLYLALLTLLALAVQGYHLGTEDQAIYLPAIKKILHPALYPHDAEFFLVQTRPTLFPQLIALSQRASHLPLEVVIFLWQIASIFLVLWACLLLARKCFPLPSAQWAAVTLVAVLLTLPVAGTALFLVDPYLHPRTLATAALLFMLADVLDRRPTRALLWLIPAATMHIQMSFYGALLALFLLIPEPWLSWFPLLPKTEPQRAGALLFPLSALFQPASPAWKEAARTRWYHYLLRWPWSAWIGIFAPLALLYWFNKIGGRKQMDLFANLCRRLLLFGIFIFAVSAVLTMPPALERFTPYQPMRGFHLLYILLILFIGGLVGEFMLRRSFARWLALFLPLCLLMFYVQRQTLPASPHIELPGVASQNAWLRAFDWIRQSAPANAYFVLDPYYTQRPGEDVHGFRAFAERSMMADYVKDSGVALLFPSIAGRWQREVHARDGWLNFTAADFHRLHTEFGVDWAVVENSQPVAKDLSCPYANDLVQVCRIP